MRKFILLLMMAYISDTGLSEAQVFDAGFIKQQVSLDGNNISTWIQNSGTFNQDIRTNNTPGLMWPKGTSKFVIFTSGINIGAYVNGALRLATASYSGEYQPGYIDGNGNPITDNRFGIYTVSIDDNCDSNPDWTNWGLMVPHGAPYQDINFNGQYDSCIDILGIQDAEQTMFICLTDGFPESHSQSEGFSGGTEPLKAEVRLTAWCYDKQGFENVQFFKWEVINKNDSPWERTYFSIFSNPDLGDASDNYLGCDTNLGLSYCYNSDNIDGSGNPPTYGQNPPAVGMQFLESIKRKDTPGNNELGMTSFVFISNTGSGGITCEQDPSQPIEAYNFLKGYKKDGTPYLIPATLQPTKIVYPGDPVSMTGWSERGTDGNPNLAYVDNCGGNLTGTVSTSAPGQRRYVMTSGSNDLVVAPLDTQIIIISQMVARGSNNLNSVTKLKRLARITKNIFPLIYGQVSTTPPVSNIPEEYYLNQNFPNPFNPVTEIEFGLPKETNVNLIVYDMTGKEVRVLLNSEMSEGNYSVKFDGTGLSSGVYFYKFKAFGYIETKKMLLIK